MEISKDVAEVFHQSLFFPLFVFNSQTSISFEKFQKSFHFLSLYPFFLLFLCSILLCVRKMKSCAWLDLGGELGPKMPESWLA